MSRYVPSSPHFFRPVGRALVLGVLALAVLAWLVPAPLEPPADPSQAPNPAKSAWFLLWVQELVSHGTAYVSVAVALAALLVALFLAPPALLGLLAHAPAYNLVGPLAKRLSHGNTDIVATIKVLGAFLFFPLTWIGLGTAAGLAWGLPLGLLAGLALPLLGYLALLLLERWEATVAALRALGLSLFRRRAFARLLAERAAIAAEIRSLRIAECRT